MVCLVMCLFNQISSWGWPFNHLSEVTSVGSQGLSAPHRKREHSCPRLPQFTRCSSHWNHFTQSHVVNYEVEVGPTTPCALSAACEGGVSIWELCCCAVQKQRRTHYTMQPSAILIQLSLKRTAWLKKVQFLCRRWQASFTITLKIKPVDLDRVASASATLLCDVNADDRHCCVRVTDFQNQSQGMCLVTRNRKYIHQGRQASLIITTQTMCTGKNVIRSAHNTVNTACQCCSGLCV